MSDLNCTPEQFKGRIIFMSMYNDIIREIHRTNKYVLLILSLWKTMQEGSLSNIGHSSGRDQKRNRTQQTLTSLADNGTWSLKS